ncbi:MAG: hypothetical protein HC826_01380 [Rhodospirillales bacterium]|nr:hypothetical protein [Rhodospirillales bacterium]
MSNWLNPQVFEIGQTTAVNLLTPPSDRQSLSDPCDSDWMSVSGIEPIRPQQLPAAGTVWAMLGVGILVLLVVILTISRGRRLLTAGGGSPTWRDMLRRNKMLIAAILVLGGATALLINGPLRQAAERGLAEPFMWIEGISVWPSIALRTLGLVITVGLTVYFCVRNEKRAQAISDRFGLGTPAAPRRLHRRWWQAALVGPRLDLTGYDDDGRPISDRSQPPVDIATLWHTYLRATSWREMGWWIALCIVLTLAAGMIAMNTLGHPSFPGRGQLVTYFHFASLIASVPVLWAVIFWVSYETRTCASFLKVVSGLEHVQLERLTVCKEADNTVPRACKEPYVAFRLIVQVTKRIQALIYLPFILILFMVVARSQIFDALDFPLPLVLLTGFALSYALLTAALLRRRAEAARAGILEQLECLLLKTPEEGDDKPSVRPDQVKLMMERVRGNREGAFAPFSRQPALQALLLPFGGYGGLQIIEHFLINANI